MKISKNILRKIIREEVRTLMEATEIAEWTEDELKLIKKMKVKVMGKMEKFSIEKSGGKDKVAKLLILLKKII